MAVKQDILEMVMPLSKILQDIDLLTPELINAVRKCVEAIGKVKKLVDECGDSVFTQFENVFPGASAITMQLQESDDIVINDRPSRNTVEENTVHTNIQGFRLCGSVDVALNKTRWRFDSILTTLSEVITNRFEAIIENPIYKAMAIFLDTSTYGTMGFEIVVDSMRKIAEKFCPQLEANNCNTDRIKTSFWF